MLRVPTFQRDDLRGDGGAICAARKSRTARGPTRPVAVTHQFATIVCAHGGRAVVEQPERWNLGAGDVLLVPAGQPHRFLELEDFEWSELAVCVACVPSNGDAGLLEPFERVRDGRAPVVRIAEDRRPFLESLFRELVATSSASDESAARHSLLTLVLREVQRAARAAFEPQPAPGIVAEALRFIERNCLRRVSLADVARAVGRSPAYVTSTLTRATGRSAVAWITAGRMAEARRRLLHSDEMVDVIAERVGYADPTHFIRTFRREHGVTPAAWRAARRRAPRR